MQLMAEVAAGGSSLMTSDVSRPTCLLHCNMKNISRLLKGEEASGSLLGVLILDQLSVAALNKANGLFNTSS